MKYTLAILALLALSISAWNIPLKRVEVSQEGVPINEVIYTSNVNFGNELREQYVPTIFDITSDDTWILESTICKDCVNSGPGPFTCVQSDYDCHKSSDKGADSYGFAGQVQFTSPDGPSKNTYIEGTDNYNIDGVQFKKADVQFPVQVLPSPKNAPELDLLKHAQASIGLGHAENKRDINNFASYVHNENHSDAHVEGEEFSFYFNDKIAQLIVGEPQGFFKYGEWTTIKSSEQASSTQIKNAYSTEISNVAVDSTQISLKSDSLTQYAIFTSTSKYISFENPNTLQSIVNEINGFTSNKAGCSEKGENNYYYVCNDVIHELPTLTLTLGGQKFKLSPEDYTESIEENGDKKLLLLLRRGLYGYQNYIQSSLGGSENYVWIGYPFYNRYYVNFQYAKDNYKIQVAEKFEFTPASPQLNSTTRNLFLILGGLATLATVGIILATLKKVPFNGVVSQPNKLQQSATKFSSVAPVQRLATVTNQPVNVSYVQAATPTKVFASSPVKIVNAQPQFVNVGASRTIGAAPQVFTQSPVRYIQSQGPQ